VIVSAMSGGFCDTIRDIGKRGGEGRGEEERWGGGKEEKGRE
jgi:hypothetical protein